LNKNGSQRRDNKKTRRALERGKTQREILGFPEFFTKKEKGPEREKGAKPCCLLTRQEGK